MLVSMESPNFLIWNVQGLSKRARRDNDHKVVDASRSAVVCLQETKLANITQWGIMSFLSRDFQNFAGEGHLWGHSDRLARRFVYR